MKMVAMSIKRKIIDAAVRLGPRTYRSFRAAERMLRPSIRDRFHSNVMLYRALIPKHGLCYDVGANIGEKSEALLRAGMRVIAFEPNIRVIPELLARVGSHSDWRLITAGAHHEPALLKFFARASSGHSGFLHKWETSSILDEVLVPAIPLDYVLRETGPPAYIKIDVEGWELAVLKGLSAPVPLLSFEFHLYDDQLARTRQCMQRLLELSPEYEVNVTPAEQARFIWAQWSPLSEVIQWFPGDLRNALPGHPYGDIYVRGAARQ